MTCHDAREQLSAPLDDPFAASEREAVEAHLATCSECRRELARLRGTVTLLGRLPPVHAPAGFVDRVMAESFRSSWRHRLLQALFRPLRVKLPLEAAALVLVGVSALYVYQHTPEILQLAPQAPGESSPAPHLAPDTRPTFPASRPPVSATAGRPGASKDRELDTKRGPAARERAREESRQASSPTAPPPVTSVQPESAAQGSAFQEAPAAKVETKSEATEGAAQATGPPLAGDAVGGRPRVASAPVGPGPTETETGDVVAGAKSWSAARLMPAVDASGRLAVAAREPAESAIDALLRRLDATRVARRLEGEERRVVIDVLVPGARYAELVEGLGRIGRWVTDHEPRALPAEMRVEVALTVEP
jgi:anti-sigma factor RsiW